MGKKKKVSALYGPANLKEEGTRNGLVLGCRGKMFRSRDTRVLFVCAKHTDQVVDGRAKEIWVGGVFVCIGDTLPFAVSSRPCLSPPTGLL